MSSEAISCFPDDIAQVADSEERLNTRTNLSFSIAAAVEDENSAATDDDLLRRVASGEQRALSLLFHRHARTVFHVAWRILRDEAEAHDLRQDVFVYVFERAQLFDPQKGSAVSWIMQVAYHRAFNRRKFLARRAGETLDILDQKVHGSTAPLSTDQIDGKAILDRVKDDLTPPQQQTLEMHLFEGYSLREIAEETNQTLVNVRHHYYRALDRLRQNVFSKKPGMSERIGTQPHRKGN